MSTFQEMTIHGLRDLDAPAARTLDFQLRIIRAIEFWNRRQKFWFHDADFEIPTSSGKAVYTKGDGAPPDLAFIKGDLWVVVNGDTSYRYRCIRRSPDFIQSLDEHSFSSHPSDWCVWSGDGLRLYPAPNGSHILSFRGEYDFPPPAKRVDSGAGAIVIESDQDDFTNAWFTEGYELIRLTAQQLYAEQIEKDPQAAALYSAGAERERQALESRTEDLQLADQTDPWPPMGAGGLW